MIGWIRVDLRRRHLMQRPLVHRTGLKMVAGEIGRRLRSRRRRCGHEFVDVKATVRTRGRPGYLTMAGLRWTIVPK